MHERGRQSAVLYDLGTRSLNVETLHTMNYWKDQEKKKNFLASGSSSSTASIKKRPDSSIGQSIADVPQPIKHVPPKLLVRLPLPFTGTLDSR